MGKSEKYEVRLFNSWTKADFNEILQVLDDYLCWIKLQRDGLKLYKLLMNLYEQSWLIKFSQWIYKWDYKLILTFYCIPTDFMAKLD